MIGLELGKYLTTQSTILNRLSNRLYPDVKPQANTELPNAVITIVGGNPDYGILGPIADLKKVVQVDVDASTRWEANEIAGLVRVAIEFSPSIPGNQTWGDTTVLSCVVEEERDTQFPPKDASDQWIYRRSIDYSVRYVR